MAGTSKVASSLPSQIRPAAGLRVDAYLRMTCTSRGSGSGAKNLASVSRT